MVINKIFYKIKYYLKLNKIKLILRYGKNKSKKITRKKFGRSFSLCFLK